MSASKRKNRLKNPRLAAVAPSLVPPTKRITEAACACDDPLQAVREAAREAGEEVTEELTGKPTILNPPGTSANGTSPAPASPAKTRSATGVKLSEPVAPTAPPQLAAMTESVEDEEEPTVRVQRVIARQLMVICTLAVMATLYFAQAVFIPLAMAVVLYLLFRPVVQWLCRRRVPAMVSASLCLLSVGVLGVVCVLPLVSAGQDWLTELPQQMDRAKGRLTAISKPLENISGTWAKVEKMAVGGDERLPQQVVVQQPELTGRTILLSTTTNMLGSLLVVVVMVFFLLTSGDQLLNRLIEQFPSFREKRRIVELILSVQNGLSFYLFTITQINLAFGLAIGLAMWAFGLPNPALWGLMAAVFNFVPFVGAAVGGAVVGFVALVSFESLSYAALAPLTYYALATVEGNVITPALIGRKMSLSPIMVLVFLIFWGWMWGIAGAALAVPILAMLKLGMDRFEPTQSAAALLGE